MAAGTAGRYQRVAKTRITYLHWADGDQTRVASQGTLYGRLSDGAEFHDVRYLDLFTLVDGQICRQEFYNDFGG